MKSLMEAVATIPCLISCDKPVRFTGRIVAGSAADGKRVSEPPRLSAAGLAGFEVFASAGAPPDLRNARIPDLEGGLLAVGAVSVPVRLPFGGLQDESWP
ncbi:MAG: hypothetical protein LUE08_04310 [Akkermansiaceae bacterium]|nr:hypothetical protein [Akkermansiaceae bacterium]